jgi:predicted SAM-dependent methyltransferase
MRAAIASAESPFKIEVGAATTSRTGWLSGDITYRTRNYMDATERWPFADGSASHVYADNVVEHLGMSPNRRLLQEAFRVLRPGGRIRLVTPDVERLARIYLTGGQDADQHIQAARASGYEAHHPVDLLRIVFQEAGHHVGYLWDLQALKAELEGVGFVSVVRQEPGSSDDEVFRGLESRNAATPGETSIALIVEASRPLTAI